MRSWWVNQNQTFAPATAGGYPLVPEAQQERRSESVPLFVVRVIETARRRQRERVAKKVSLELEDGQDFHFRGAASLVVAGRFSTVRMWVFAGAANNARRGLRLRSSKRT
jgi:hypothetical protein